MIDVVVFVVLTVAVAAPLCGHQGQPWPLRGLCARLAAEVAVRAPGLLRARVRPPDGRVRLRAARVPGSASGVTGPSRRQAPRWAAERPTVALREVRTPPRPAEARTVDSDRREAA